MKHPNRQNHLEPLEPRRLLAGVTILIHGNEGNITGWVDYAANEIAKRVPGNQSKYIMKVEKVDDDKLGVTAFTLYDGPELSQNESGEVIVKLDWTAVDSGKYSTDEVGAAVSDYLMHRHGSVRALAELPIHLIGHSRGASMISAISRDLGRHGIWVDQNTYLDPHPVDGHDDILNADSDDTPMRVYDNVLFADNYWRTDGNSQNADPDGEFVDGAHDVNLDDSVQERHVVSAHMAVTSYYHGTIDHDSFWNGDHPILPSWYAEIGRDETGFIFSRIAGGKRPSDGVPPVFGGTADRADSGDEVGNQWGNSTNLRILEGRTIPIGPRASLRFLRSDRDSANEITVFLDPDTNPFNGNNVRTLRRFQLDGVDEPTSTKVSIPTDEILPGTYYIGVQCQAEDGTLRLAYTPQIEVVESVSSQSVRSRAPFSTTAIDRPPAVSTSAHHDDRISDLVLG